MCAAGYARAQNDRVPTPRASERSGTSAPWHDTALVARGPNESAQGARGVAASTKSGHYCIVTLCIVIYYVILRSGTKAGHNLNATACHCRSEVTSDGHESRGPLLLAILVDAAIDTTLDTGAGTVQEGRQSRHGSPRTRAHAPLVADYDGERDTELSTPRMGEPGGHRRGDRNVQTRLATDGCP